ncbi:MAG: competence protein CoiA family protein [Phycisphaerae bacterium]|jgi:hypothetical protein
MLYGIANNGSRIFADKDILATCPHCKGGLVAKCGQIKVHHWAHKQAKGCLYSHGMTKWHYDWLIHFNNHLSQGWEIEYFFNSVRFDAYNSGKKIAIEFQRIIDLDYINQKIEVCKNAGIKLYWIISPLIFQNFIYTSKFMGDDGCVIFPSKNCKLKILALLENYISNEYIKFVIDFKKNEYLPKYSTGEFNGGGSYWYTIHYEMRPNPMKQGVYLIRKMHLFNNRCYYKKCVLLLECLTL